MKMSHLGKYPLLLRPDNFTPLSRTPWAGKRIGQFYKAVVCPEAISSRIGESWEFSCDPDFPSRLIDGTALLDAIGAAPVEMLGAGWNKGDGTASCEILVKLIQADEPLSLQIHPRDGDRDLQANECGKPESWLVLDSAPGAGLYLGFNRRMSRDELREILKDGDRAKDVLQFVPVKAGDYFEIEPGVPHAIGPGVTILEPQRILFGKSGKTYRFWDWGRRYDAHGRVNVDGKPRELHIEAALRLADSENQVGQPFVDSLRRQPAETKYGDGVVKTYPANAHYQLHCLELPAKTVLEVMAPGHYGVLSILEGEALLANLQRQMQVHRGHTLMLPAACSNTRISTHDSPTHIALVVPRSTEVVFSAPKS